LGADVPIFNQTGVLPRISLSKDKRFLTWFHAVLKEKAYSREKVRYPNFTVIRKRGAILAKNGTKMEMGLFSNVFLRHNKPKKPANLSAAGFFKLQAEFSRVFRQFHIRPARCSLFAC
jgi:hypothetical protein